MPKANTKTAKKTARKRAPVASPRGEATRSRLLEAAYAEFVRNGFHGTSMRQIAQAAGVAVGGIYNHFQSKEDIFAAVLDAYHPYHALLPVLDEAEGETLAAFVLDAGRRIQAAVKGAENHILPLISIELVEFQGRHIKDLAAKLFPKLLVFAQRFAERGASDERVRDLPLPVVVRAFASLMLGFALSEALLVHVAQYRAMEYDWLGQTVDIYLHGILAPGAAQPDGRTPAEA
jgi:AcrR family transcriptional regulator